MLPVYEHHHAVAPEEIDSQGHANNVAYVNWMQDAAVAHSRARGWTDARYHAMGQGWVARSHWIEYRQPAMPGDRIIVRTWVATMTKVTSTRRYRILREGNGDLLAVAETNWAFIDYTTGRPCRIPAEVVASFQLVTDPVR